MCVYIISAHRVITAIENTQPKSKVHLKSSTVTVKRSYVKEYSKIMVAYERCDDNKGRIFSEVLLFENVIAIVF